MLLLFDKFVAYWCVKGFVSVWNVVWKEAQIWSLRVFGCLCYAKVLPCFEKFSSRSIPSLMMGYSLIKKGLCAVKFVDENNVC